MPISHIFSSPLGSWGSASTDPTGVTIYDSTGGSATTAVSNIIGPQHWNANHVISLSASDISSMFSAEHRVTLSTGAGGLTFGLDNQIVFFEPYPAFAANVASTVMSNGVWYLDPIQLPGALNSGQIRGLYTFGVSTGSVSAPGGFLASTISQASTGSVSKYGTFWNRIAFFLRGNAGNTINTNFVSSYTNSNSLYSYWSNEDQYIWSAALAVTATSTVAGTTSQGASYTQYMSFPSAYDSAGGRTYGTTSVYATGSTTGTTGSLAISAFTSIASLSSFMNLLTGGLILPIGLNTRLSAGEWFIGFNHQTSTSQSLSSGYSNFGIFGSSVSKHILSEISTLNSNKLFGQSVSNSGTYMFPGHGYWSSANSTSNSSAQHMAVTDIKAPNTIYRMYWNYDQYTQ